MCLAKAYLSQSGDEPVLQDIAHMQMCDDGVGLETLEPNIIRGMVRSASNEMQSVWW
jgi:hypothetical protein